MAGPRRPAAPPALDASQLISLVEDASGEGEAYEIPSTRPFLRVRKVAVPGPNGTMHEIEDYYWTRDSLRKWLAACPKLLVSVPRDPTNDPDDLNVPCHMTVIYDGYRFDVPKGRAVRIPAPIAEIVRQSQQKFRTAQSLGLDLYEITTRNDKGAYIDYEGGGGAYASPEAVPA